MAAPNRATITVQFPNYESRTVEVDLTTHTVFNLIGAIATVAEPCGITSFKLSRLKLDGQPYRSAMANKTLAEVGLHDGSIVSVGQCWQNGVEYKAMIPLHECEAIDMRIAQKQKEVDSLLGAALEEERAATNDIGPNMALYLVAKSELEELIRTKEKLADAWAAEIQRNASASAAEPIDEFYVK